METLIDVIAVLAGMVVLYWIITLRWDQRDRMIEEYAAREALECTPYEEDPTPLESGDMETMKIKTVAYRTYARRVIDASETQTVEKKSLEDVLKDLRERYPTADVYECAPGPFQRDRLVDTWSEGAP